MNSHHLWWIILPVFFLYGCKDQPVSQQPVSEELPLNVKRYEGTPPIAYSLLGEPLYRKDGDPASERRKDSLLFDAQGKYFDDSNDMDNIIWYGRRMAYKDYHNEAIAMFTEGIEKHPNSPELYRHRGHRYITTRRFNMALLDFKKAAELVSSRRLQIEPDGIPNKINQPLSTLQFNIFYHLGLAHYLLAEYEQALDAYEKCMTYSNNDDLLVATADWLYLTLMKLDKQDQALDLLKKIKSNMNIVENDAYHKRLLVYKGELDPEQFIDLSQQSHDPLKVVTMGYGLANHYLFKGNKARYLDLLEDIINTGYWAAFGYIAAEADLQRIRTGS